MRWQRRPLPAWRKSWIQPPPNIVEEGYLPTERTSPSISKNTLIGGLAGVVPACGIVFALFIMNDTVKTPEDEEKYLGLNTLAAVPVFDGDASAKKKRSRKHESRRKAG